MLVSRHRRRAVAGLCAVLAAALLGSCSGESVASRADQEMASSEGVAKRSKPNIVYVLTDDFSENLVKYMPHVRKMKEEGASFTNFFATDSLCCPSRSSILTGQYPHNTGVFTNSGEDGGYGAFKKNGNAKRCFGSALQDAGYRTGFMGKYLNGYWPDGKKDKGVRKGGSKGVRQGAVRQGKQGKGGKRQLDAAADGVAGRGASAVASASHVPTGWDEWDVAGDGYKEFDYDLNENGKVVPYGSAPKDYLTDVLSDKAASFVNTSEKSKKPFILEVATFAPHGPATPAPRDENTFQNLKAPRTAAFDKAPTPAPKWQKSIKPLTPEDKAEIDRKFAKRVRSVQAVDDMVGRLQDQLKKKGLADDTYFVFGSDNGFHMGEHRLRPGKQTAYDTDIKVPLMVTGPGVPEGKKISQLAENTDLSPTFQDLAGEKPASTVDGRSLAGLLRGQKPDRWRQAALVEHHRAKSKKADPDAAPDNSGNPPDYEALRTSKELYVEYAGGDREYYRTDTDPHQLKNRARDMSEKQRTSLHKTLTALKSCRGAKDCEAASQLQK
ncbi:sulfatase [Streptomyces sp. NBC_01775]|uniref:sulfatase family protein n=1 Tax=Streptomyces sp. NBC_01775 TaxID=2975939 RepID=UPI002DDA8156|nr:sulfatase [Streptomyces sp. NBC_01775]WSB75728.1 sulfatase [Streptomyces sp. NBC_01775]